MPEKGLTLSLYLKRGFTRTFITTKSYHLVITCTEITEVLKEVGVMLAINNKLICEQFSVPNGIEAIAVTIKYSKN